MISLTTTFQLDKNYSPQIEKDNTHDIQSEGKLASKRRMTQHNISDKKLNQNL